MNLGQCVWTADWTINDVELPHDLPAPVCSPHELCRAAAKAIKDGVASPSSSAARRLANASSAETPRRRSSGRRSGCAE